MNFEEVIGRFGVYGASFVIGFVSGLVPFVNSEVYLLFVSPFSARPTLVPIAILSASGQLLAKTILYLAGRGVISMKMTKMRDRIDAVHKKFVEWRHKTDALIFVSSALGLPPFYVVSVVAGAAKLNFPKFFVIGLVGRSMRFAVIVLFPQFVMRFI